MRDYREITKALLSAGLIGFIIFALAGHSTAQTCTPAPSGLIAWWPGDGNASDIVGQNNGTMKNGATFAVGKVGQAFSFDGADDYVQVSRIQVPANTWTMGAWIHPADFTCPNGGECLVLDIGSSGVNGLILSLYAGKPYVQWGTGAAAATAGLGGSSSQILLNQWTHIAAAHDGIAGSFYVNGQLVEQYAAPSNVIPLPEAFIGKMHDGEAFRPFNGLVDEVEVYNRALGADEIAAIFNAGSAGKCEGAPAGALWVGLKNSDDQGTRFDMEARLYQSLADPIGSPIATSLTRCVTGVTRNPSAATEVPISFPSFQSAPRALRFFTRIGTNQNDTKCTPGPGGSHNNATGLRLYYDSTTRPSGLTDESLYLHSNGSSNFLDGVAPVSSIVKYQDSTGIDFSQGCTNGQDNLCPDGRNQWKEIGTGWSE